MESENAELRERVKELEERLGQYSDYFSLTLDGQGPEDAGREVGLL